MNQDFFTTLHLDQTRYRRVHNGSQNHTDVKGNLIQIVQVSTITLISNIDFSGTLLMNESGGPSSLNTHLYQGQSKTQRTTDRFQFIQKRSLQEDGHHEIA